ncbi:hypothetical protein ACE10Z_14665 [Bradyrhizobium sp. Pha-3]|uniref:hypothetical protein n=1 Tax=Bradyrhizobium sp. Pha-3 TaxID=208375 RepID=UPI0035D41D1C
MIFLGIILSVAAIGFFCWLLFTLAVFALPFFAGVTAGTWAYHAGVGWLGAILIGIIGAALTLGLTRILLGTVRPLWAQLLIALVFVAPAAVAGCHATHGIVRHTVPSEIWQLVFSLTLARYRDQGACCAPWRSICSAGHAPQLSAPRGRHSRRGESSPLWARRR